MKIPQNIIDELIAQAEKDAPDESCGYLLGTDDNVTENYWMENIDHSSEHFSFAPKDQFAALRYAREHGLKILANWHSHPASPRALHRKTCVWPTTLPSATPSSRCSTENRNSTPSRF